MFLFSLARILQFGSGLQTGVVPHVIDNGREKIAGSDFWRRIATTRRVPARDGWHKNLTFLFSFIWGSET
jgi:hypothetical protein